VAEILNTTDKVMEGKKSFIIISAVAHGPPGGLQIVTVIDNALSEKISLKI
jgi:hypothetical protein